MSSPQGATTPHVLDDDDLQPYTVDELHTLGRDTVRRRKIAAYALACPKATRPSSEALGVLLGVTPSTIRMDWTRTDVRALARSATAAGMVALMLATARSCVVALCARAAEGDVAASIEVRAWLHDLGALDRVSDAAADDAGTGYGAGALASADAADALAAALASLDAG